MSNIPSITYYEGLFTNDYSLYILWWWTKNLLAISKLIDSKPMINVLYEFEIFIRMLIRVHSIQNILKIIEVLYMITDVYSKYSRT